MLLKELTDVAEPALESKDQRPRKLVPDYAKQAKGFLETRIASAFGGIAAPSEEVVPDHVTAQPLTIAFALQTQQNQGNFYVQQAIETYRKKHPSLEESATSAKPLAEENDQQHQSKEPATKQTAQTSSKAATTVSAAEGPSSTPISKPRLAGPGVPATHVLTKDAVANEKTHPGVPSGKENLQTIKKAVATGPGSSAVKFAAGAAPPQTIPKLGAKPSRTGKTTGPQVAVPVPAAPQKQVEAAKPSVVPGGRAGAEQKPPENPAKQETKAQKLSTDAQGGKAQITAVTPLAKQSVDGGGGAVSPSASIQDWSAKVTGDAQKTLKPPELEAGQQAPDQIKSQGATLLQQQQANHPDYMADANKNLPPPPKLENPPEEPADPIEKQSRDVIALSATSRLTDQTLPPLESTPGYAKDDKKIPARMPSFTPPPPMTDTAQSSPPADKSGADQVQTDTTKKDDAQKKIDQPATAAQGASPQQLTLKDKGPAPKPVVPESMQSDIAATLQAVLAKSDEAAQMVVDQAELAAFPGGALKAVEPKLAAGHLGPEKQDIEKELRQVADVAGVEIGVVDRQAATAVKDTQQQGDNNAASLETSAAEAKQNAEAQGQGQRTSIATAGQSVRSSVEQKKEAAATASGDDKAIEEKEKRLIAQLRKDAALDRAQYSKALEKRQSELDQAAGTYASAYQRAARQEADEIKALYSDDDVKARVESRPSLDWGDKEVKTIQEQLPRLKRDAGKETDSFKSTLDKQELAAIEMVRTWADNHVGTWRSFWRRILDLFSGWAEDAKASTEAWEEVRDQETTSQLVEDLGLIAKLKDLAAKGNMEELQKAVAGLNADQQALMLLFFATGPDSVITLATTLESRIEALRIPPLTEQLRTEALDLDWEKLDSLGRAQDSGFSAFTQATLVQSAISGAGTNNEKLFGAIGRRTPVQMAAIKKCYAFLYPLHPDMEAEINDEWFSDDNAKRAKAALSSDPTGEDIFALHDAISSLNTDEAAIMKLLRNKTPEERDKIFERYKQEYNIDLKDHLHQELSGDDSDRADALLDGNTTKADAIAVQQSMHYHWYGGSEITELDSVYGQIRQEVEAEAATKHMTTAEVEAEVKRRGQAVQREWEAKYGDGKTGSMTAAFQDNYQLAEQNLALGLSENDRTAQDAARIAMESQSTYTKDEKVLQVLSAQRERADKEIHRDMAVHFKEQAAKEKWSPEVAKQKWDEMSAQADKDIDAKAEENLANLDKVFDKDYSYLKSLYGTYDYDSDTFSPAKESALSLVVSNEMSGKQQEMAKLIRAKGSGGKMNPEDELFWSIEGLGTDEDHLKHALLDENGKPKWTKDQLKTLREKYYEKHKPRTLDDDVAGDTSGRLGFDMKLALEGKPETPEEYHQQMQAKTEYELGGSGGIGFLFAADESIALARTAGEADKSYQKYLAAEKAYGKDSAQAKAEFARYQRWSSYTDDAVQGTREAVDAITDHAAMVAAIVVGVVVAIATAGTAAPAVVAAISAGAAALTSLSVKAAMKGNAYSLEELGTDAAIGVVDVAAAALTAGIGSALLRTNILARLSEEQLGTRLLRQGLAHGVGGMVAGVPAGVAGLALNDQTWKSDAVLKTFLLGTLQTAGTGFAFGSAFGMLHGIKAPPPEAHVAGGKTGAGGEVPVAKPKPDLAANTKATVDAHPNNVESQLKPIINADEHPQTPGSPESEMAQGVAKVKAIGDPATPEAQVDQTIKDLAAAGESGKAGAAPKGPGGEPGEPEVKPVQPEGKKAAAPGEGEKVSPDVKKEVQPAAGGEGGEGKAPQVAADKGIAGGEPAEKPLATDQGVGAKPSEKPVAEVVPEGGEKTSGKAETPKPEELKAAREEKSKLTEQEKNFKNILAEKRQAVNDQQSEIEELEFEREQNAKKSPRTRDVEKEAADLERKLKMARRELDTKTRELDSSTKHFEGRLNDIQKRLGEIQALEDQFKGSKPWRAIDLTDPKTTNAQKMVIGELETALKMQEAGVKPMGDTLDPKDIVLPEDVTKAVEERQGVQDIDHLYESPDKTKWNTLAIDSKATGTPVEGDPSGRGLLAETNNGYQLSDKWLIGNARKSGLEGAELEQFIKDVKAGKVRRIYSVTDPNGTRFYEVQPIGDTDVKIGKEITDEFKKKP